MLTLIHFYPRSPRGERPLKFIEKQEETKFLSTLPAWGATPTARAVNGSVADFYPRSPRGERRFLV